MTHPDTTAQDKAMREALLPCPFCGGSNIKTKHDDGRHWGECQGCFSTGPANSRYAEDGDPDWNTRTPNLRALLSDPKLVEDVARAFLSDSFKGIGRQSIPPGILAHAEEQAQAALLAIRKTLGVE
jgi:hypothetical protein